MHAISAVVVGRKHFESLRTHMMQSLHLQKPGANPVLQCGLEGLAVDPLVFAALETVRDARALGVDFCVVQDLMLALLVETSPNSTRSLKSFASGFTRLDLPRSCTGLSLTPLVRSAYWHALSVNSLSDCSWFGLLSWLLKFGTAIPSAGSSRSMLLRRAKPTSVMIPMTKVFSGSTCMGPP
jgi:hypothetical protein